MGIEDPFVAVAKRLEEFEQQYSSLVALIAEGALDHSDQPGKNAASTCPVIISTSAAAGWLFRSSLPFAAARVD